MNSHTTKSFREALARLSPRRAKANRPSSEETISLTSLVSLLL